MPSSKTKNSEKSQLDRFREIARQIECDEDKERFEEKLRKIAKTKPKSPSPREMIRRTAIIIDLAY
jgi:hypothetical protein